MRVALAKLVFEKETICHFINKNLVKTLTSALIDKSWHNDQCPSFYFKVGEQYYVLWVDYADVEQREEIYDC